MENPLSTAKKILKTSLTSDRIIRDCISIKNHCSTEELETLSYLYTVYEGFELDVEWAKDNVENGHPFRLGDYKYVRQNKEKL